MFIVCKSFRIQSLLENMNFSLLKKTLADFQPRMLSVVFARMQNQTAVPPQGIRCRVSAEVDKNLVPVLPVRLMNGFPEVTISPEMASSSALKATLIIQTYLSE